MLADSKFTQETYVEMMNAIKSANAGYNEIYKIPVRSQVPLMGRVYNYMVRKISQRKRLKAYDQELSQFPNLPRNETVLPDSAASSSNQFFSNDRIAIYTSVFGTYDHIHEPLVSPDNCDYYIVTDQDVNGSSKWCKKNIEEFDHLTKEMTTIEKNRFFKMNPHLLFPDYTYSIYIDGNIQVMTDLTEFIYQIGPSGIAVHKHRERDCVYEEAREVLLLNRDSVENITKHIHYIAETNMPRNYGLLECNVLVRKHHDPICQKFMEDWWTEFSQYSNRDQLAFAHTLFQNNLTLKDLGLIGNNVYENYAFKIHRHK
ncbi:glycosyltransferase domain-containing protein [Litchfieldia salsa]|uniref:TOD1/MUCI70 glycosyltransferase-like domain-containing protein n=1 Tax=Litchfieldia salsa TaxID=930152 RepID=A0A1H0W612_9BACI|nr:glycosyltransferase domain-containing protein [Litchfieldia salsa]SDP85746.1 Protein of unknown function [Litchfieldia salsa]